MKPSRRHRLWDRFLLAITLIVLVVWWFFISDWVSKPGTYRISVLFIGAVVVTGIVHIRALIRFHRIVHRIHIEENLGTMPDGSVVFALNQRFRYLMRTIETGVVLIVGIVAFISVAHPAIALNREYQRLVITYFIGSILITGYLTLRDLAVLNVVRAMASAPDDDVILSAPGHNKPPSGT